MAPRKKRKPAGQPAGKRRGGPPRALVFLGVLIGAVAVFLGKLIIRFAPKGPQIVAFCKMRVVQRIALMCLIAVGVSLSFWAARSHLQGQAKYQVQPSDISIQNFGISWAGEQATPVISEQIEASVRHRLKALEDRSIFDETLLEDVYNAISADPWIAKVYRVERQFPDDQDGKEEASGVSIQLAVRKPVMVVELNHTWYLVDREAIVLPLKFKLNAEGSPAEKKDLALLSDLKGPLRLVKYVAPGEGKLSPHVGKVWNNQQVLAALSVERTLREHSVDQFYPVRTIDVRDVYPAKLGDGSVYYTPGKGIRLSTLHPSSRKKETVVIWGKAPKDSSLHDPSVEDKVERLREFTVRYKDLSIENQDFFRLRNGR